MSDSHVFRGDLPAPPCTARGSGPGCVVGFDYSCPEPLTDLEMRQCRLVGCAGTPTNTSSGRLKWNAAGTIADGTVSLTISGIPSGGRDCTAVYRAAVYPL